MKHVLKIYRNISQAKEKCKTYTEMEVFTKVKGIVRTVECDGYRVMFRSSQEVELPGFLMNVRVDEVEGLEYVSKEMAQKLRRQIAILQADESQ